MADISNLAPVQGITYSRGTTWNPPITVTYGPASLPYNLAGALLLFVVKRNPLDLDSQYLLKKDSALIGGITLSSPLSLGTGNLIFGATDCLDPKKFPESKALYYAIKLLVGSNPEVILVGGTFTVVTPVVQQT